MKVSGDLAPPDHECLFCGKSPNEVFMMFAHKLVKPLGERSVATICCECVDTSYDVLVAVSREFEQARQKPMH
jgi:hypothetical protein